MKSIVDRSDSEVGTPLPRETLLETETGFLVSCTGTQCDWQGLFPTATLALQAVENHKENEYRRQRYRFGHTSHTIIELVDEATAFSTDLSEPGLSVEELRLGEIDGSVREFEFPRTTGDVSDLVGRGDVIETNTREGKVVRVTETRSHGLPTWTVVYVDPDIDIPEAKRGDYKWQNELVAQEGDIYRSYGIEPLTAPAFSVLGTAEHQTSLIEIATDGGEEA